MVLAQGWTSSATAQALEWGPHSNGPLLSLPKGSVDAVIPADTGAEPVADAPRFSRGQAPPGLQPGLQRRWGALGKARAHRKPVPGHQSLGAAEGQPLPLRLGPPSGEVKRCCRTALPSKAEALPQDLRLDSWHPANADPTFSVRLYWPAPIELMAVKMGWVSNIGNRPLAV